MYNNLAIGLFSLLSLTSLFLRGEKKDAGLISDKLAKIILEEVSGEKPLADVQALVHFDRITGSKAYDQAADHVLNRLQEFGIINSKIESFPPQWSGEYYMKNPPGWWPLPGWTVKRGILKVTAPEMTIADYAEEPITLARMSRSYKGRAEIVYAGKGETPSDYAGLEIDGKIVLATGAAGTVHDQAVMKRGALGVICFGASSYDNLKGRENPEMVVWQVLSPLENLQKRPQYAFSISAEKGRALLSLLEKKKKLEVDVDVETEFYQNDLRIVNALIAGSARPEEEFLLYAHLDHVKPSAGDNASGCAILLEIARAISVMIRENKIDPPRRSIRLIWGPEGPGSLMYINAHKDMLDRTLAGLNLDMVGLDREKTRAILRITRTPDSLPSFMGDLVQNLIENLDTRDVKAPGGKRNILNFRFVPFSASSDHYFFNDGAVRVPMLMFNNSPDEFHHTNLDSPESLDATEIKKMAYLATAIALFVADADDENALNLAHIVMTNGGGRILQAVQKGLALLEADGNHEGSAGFDAGKNYIHFATKRESEATRSTARLTDDSAKKSEIEALAKTSFRVEEIATQLLCNANEKRSPQNGLKVRNISLSPEEKRALGLIPRRTGSYLNGHWEFELNSRSLAAEDRSFIDVFKKKLKDSYIRIPEILNFVDGRNNCLEIRNAVSSEYFGFMTGGQDVGHHEDIGREYRDLSIQDVMRLMEIFKKANMLTF